MTVFSKSVLAAAVFCAASFAGAAEVQIYGRIDTGLVYQNFFGDSTKSDSFTMESGPNTASRWGIQGSETLNDDVSVKFRLESRFASETGALKGNRLFEGSAYLTVLSQKFGEVSVGRIAGINSGSGIYDHQYAMDPFGGGTYGTALAPVKSSRMDNMIVYRSPEWAGLRATVQHSLKTDGVTENDEGVESESSANRFYAAGLLWQRGNLKLAGNYEFSDWGKASANARNDDRQVLTLGGSYRFEPVTVYVQTQYFDGVEKLDGFTGTGTTSLKGFGLYAGTEFWFGPSSWKSMVYWRDYEDESTNLDGSSVGVATKYVWRPSKTIEMYAGAGYAQWDRPAAAGGVLTDKTVNVFTGMTKYF